MTVCDYSALPVLYSSNGKFDMRNDLRETSYLDAEGMHMTYTATEEFIPNYIVPTLDKLDGTAEEFLKSENGNLWRQVLEEMAISNHGFPVLAVDKLGYQVVFPIRRQELWTAGISLRRNEPTEAEFALFLRSCIGKLTASGRYY